MTEDLYKHPKWQQKRLRIMERDGFRCCACGDAESSLHVHHFLYSGSPWEVSDHHLQTLCEQCHKFLGKHPKGGVYYIRHDKPGEAAQVGVMVAWCPECGQQKLEEHHGGYDCESCGWSADRYSSKHYWISEDAICSAQRRHKKPKQYSLAWLSGMIAKVRKSGPSEEELFDVLFPNFTEKQLFLDMKDAASRFAEMLKTQRMSVGEEAELLEVLVRTRRALQGKLRDIDRGDSDAR